MPSPSLKDHRQVAYLMLSKFYRRYNISTAENFVDQFA
jgi:hypothetical protein